MFGFNKEPEKNKVGTPPPQTVNLSGRANVGQLFNHYHADKDTEDLISDCYFDKRPKPYPMVYRRIYDLSRNSKLGFHVVSWCIAISFVQSLVPLLFNAASLSMFHPLQSWILGGAALAYFEYSQHQTLETLWTVYFQYKKFVPGIVLLTALFSIISIVTSVYAAFSLLENSTYQIGFVAFALFVETMIITNSYNIHNYRKKTANAVKMENDFNSGLDPGMYFHNQLGQAAQQTTALPSTRTATPTSIQAQTTALPRNYNQTAPTATKIDIESGAQNQYQQIVKPTQEEINLYAKSPEEHFIKKLDGTQHQKTNDLKPIKPNLKNAQETGQKSAKKTAQVSTKNDSGKDAPQKAQTPSLTVSKAPQELTWMEYQVRNFESSYKRKILDEGPSFAKVANKTFFTHYLKQWKQVATDGKAPQISPSDRKKWYEEQFPQKAAKLKKADAAKRKRKMKQK